MLLRRGCADSGEIADFALQEVSFLAWHLRLGPALSRFVWTGKINRRLYFVQFWPGYFLGVAADHIEGTGVARGSRARHEGLGGGVQVPRTWTGVEVPLNS